MICFSALVASLFFVFEAADYAVDGRVEVLDGDAFFVVARRDECGLVAHVCYVGAGESGGLAGKQCHVESVGHLYVAQVDAEYGFAVVDVGEFDIDLAVETSGAEEGFVEDVGAVGGSEHDNAAVAAEAVHFGEQLVEGVLALVVGAHVGIFAAGTAHGVDFVDEHDARRFFLGLTEEVADTRGADAYEHFHKVGTRH